ncbi:MAG TPA: IPT/TIG domain-containing protein [Candidatus Saccharimonadales bacterium]|nr:IPT/TIG domain-containing protein [Candidatus Saccharimonadales bacterium]
MKVYSFTRQLRFKIAAASALLLSLLAPAPPASAQIRAAVDAASFSSSIAPGSLITIFGTNLATSTHSADIFPLPNELGGVRVTFEGAFLSIVYVSDTQINAQLPFSAAGTGILRATYPSGSSELRITISPLAPAIFRSQTLKGYIPSVIHQNGTLVSAESPARPGEIISVFMTGLGQPVSSLATGAVAPAFPPVQVSKSVVVSFGPDSRVDAAFAGLAPGFAGLNQVNVQVPELAAGIFTLQVTADGVASNGLAIPLAAAGVIRNFEYVFPDGGFYVYDMNDAFSLVKHVMIPQARFIRGVTASPSTSTLYIAYGGDGGVHGNGSMLAYDLLTDQVKWSVSYPHGIDSMAIMPDGKTIYMPTGELESGSDWKAIDASNGNVIGTIQGGAGPHNTVVSLDGKRVYLGPRESRFLYVFETSTNSLIRRIGPLINTVRPFSINGRQTLAFTTATGFLGFQVSDINTGQVLHTVGVAGYGIPPGFSLSTPSHGISLSPDEKEIWLIDSANSAVHVFDVSGLPTSPPRQIADIPFSRPMTGNEQPCYFDCGRHGWIQHSRDGRFVFIGDSGDVFDAGAKSLAIHLDPLFNSRKHLEIDWNNGVPILTSSRHGLGYVTQ